MAIHEMTADEFDLVAELKRSTDPVKSCARLVLVEGQTNAQAIEWTDVSHQSISNTLGRLRSAHQKLVEAYRDGVPNDVEMTLAQFQVVAEMLRAKDHPVKAAAQLVLVEGQTNAQAIEWTDITQQMIGNFLTRFRRAHVRIAGVYARKTRARKPAMPVKTAAVPLKAPAPKTVQMRMHRARVKKTK